MHSDKAPRDAMENEFRIIIVEKIYTSLKLYSSRDDNLIVWKYPKLTFSQYSK